MTIIRRFCYFLIGFLLSAYVVISHAESIPATFGYAAKVPGFQTGGYAAGYGLTAAESCKNAFSGSTSAYVSGNQCIRGSDQYTTSAVTYCPGGANHSTSVECPQVYSCPAGQNWTLSGQSCTRPDCVAPQTRQSDGTCKQICPASELGNFWYSHLKGAPPWGTYCVSGCEKVVSGPIMDSANPNGEFYYSGNIVTERGKESMTGGSCTAGNAPPVSLSGGNQPPAPPKKPPCAAGEGVLTTSTGQVRCVPAGTPSAEKPRVGTSSSVDKKADGSSTTTTTTTTCSGEGACSSTTTTSITGAAGGSTPGQSGAPGTATKDTDSNTAGGGTSSETCDPTKQMCSSPNSEGLYTKKDMKVDEPLKKFSDGVKGSSVGQGVSGFFSVSINGGNCPNWSMTVPYLNKYISMSNVFCTPEALAMMQMVGNVLMVVAAFGAFKWAIL